jgi:hypothetical protein
VCLVEQELLTLPEYLSSSPDIKSNNFLTRDIQCLHYNGKLHVSGIMVTVLSSSVVDCGFETRTRQTKDYKEQRSVGSESG